MQTVASAAGTLSSIIFVLPGLVMIGWWNGFPYWVSLRHLRARRHAGRDVLDPAAPRAGDATPTCPTRKASPAPRCSRSAAASTASGVEENRAGLRALLWGSVVSAAFRWSSRRACSPATSRAYFRVGERGGRTGFDFGLSLALFGVGHLVGLWVGVAMLVGVLIAWVWGVPHLTALHPRRRGADVGAVAHDVWSHKVRFVGAGTIAVAAIWTLVKLVKPVVAGLRSAHGRLARAQGRPGRTAAAHRAGHADRHRRPGLAALPPARSAGCWRSFAHGAGLGGHAGCSW